MAKVSIAGIFLLTSMPTRAAGSMLVYFTVSAFSPFDFMKASITFWVKLPAPLAISRFSSCSGLVTLAPERSENIAYGAFW